MAKSPKEQELIAEVKEFIADSEGGDSTDRTKFLDDLRFVYDEERQWDELTKTARGDRPCYTFNRLIGAVNQVIGDQQQASPQIKVRGIDDESDPELAEVFSGLIRNIENTSDANSIYDMAFKYAVSGGHGGWRVNPQFASPMSFEQDLFIIPIHNPMTAFWDPLCMDPIKRGQNSFAVAERISRELHEEMFGKEMASNIEVARDGLGWQTEKEVRVAEYYKRVPVKKTIALLSDGRVIDFDKEAKTIEAELEAASAQGVDVPTIVRTRETTTHQIKWWKVDGAQILEGPITYDWEHIPAVKLPGRFVNIEGELINQSLIRHSKDAQKMYNYDRTTMMETVGNVPRAPYFVTPTQIKGLEQKWADSTKLNRPYLPYNPDPDAPGPPTRAPAAEIPVALVALAAQDSDDIKATTGQFDASLGERGPQESGEAIRARQLEGDVGSFEFMSNLGKALKYTGEILVDMIPKVYDTARVVRILGLDGEEDFVQINAYDESKEKEMFLSAGRYDVTVTIGPAYSTQRVEALDKLLQAAGVMPIVSELASDLILKNLDVPGADELVTRIRKQLIAQGIVEPNDDEEAPPPPPPDEVQNALVATEGAKARSLDAKAAKDISETEKNQAELRAMVEELIGTKLDNMFKSEEVKVIRHGEGDLQVRADD